MADYYSVLTSAIAKLDPNSETARRALYDRARQAVFNRMRAMAVAEGDIRTELAALNTAIARIEDDIARPVEKALHTPRRPAQPHAAPRPARSPTASVPAPPLAPVHDTPHLDAPAAPDGSDQVRPQRLSRPVRAGVAVAAVLIVAAVGYAYWSRHAEAPGAKPGQAAREPPAQVAAAPSGPAPQARRAPAEAGDSALPYILRRQLVYYRTTYPAGTPIIIKQQHALYLVNENASALRYSIAVGADCDNVAGMLTIASKEGGPEPSVQTTSASADQPASPARDGRTASVPTLVLGDSKCLIRATNNASVIGRDQASGGFQLISDDMLDLYDRISVGTKVVVMN